MAQPRFQLRVVRRRPPAEPNDRRIVADSRPSGRDDRIVWRLLGANNRELGRSGAQFATIDDCVESVRSLLATLDGGAPVSPSLTSSDRGGLVWWWTVRVGDQVLASAVRAFSRQIECLKNFETFSQSALVADLPSPQSTDGAAAHVGTSDRRGSS